MTRSTDSRGRWAPAPRSRTARRAEIEGRSFTRAGERGPLAALIEHATRAQARGGHRERSDGTMQRITGPAGGSKVAGSNATLSWRTPIPDLIDAEGFVTGTPAYTRESEVLTLRTAAQRSSVCLAMGAHLIEIPEGELSSDARGEPVLADLPAGFDVIRPAQFSQVELTGTGSDAEGDITAGASPIHRAEIDRASTAQIACRFEIGRGELREHGADRIEAQLMQAIAAGIGPALDKVLLDGIAAAVAPEVGDDLFAVHSICQRRGVRWSELSAAIGDHIPDIADAGARGGLSVASGELRIGGVRAEHAGNGRPTIVGVFDRAAIAVSPEIELLVERHGVAGGLSVTAWLDAFPLTPDPKYFARLGAWNTELYGPAPT